MSHFSVYVFTKDGGRDVDDLLAPYDERIVYPPYIISTKEQTIKKVRKNIEDYKNGRYAEYLADPEKYKSNCSNTQHIEYLEKEFPKKLNWTDEECYESERQYYEDDMVDEEGNLLSTYNPNSKWDWYEVGGRWSGSIVTNDGDEVDSWLAKGVNWDKTAIPFAFVDPSGKWHERGQMGWWAIVTDEKEKDEWDAEFRVFLDKLDKGVTITVVDCHI